jgi:hypothetical protein
METASGGGGFRPEEAYAASVERFFELLKTFAGASGGPGAAPHDWSSLAGPLASQFEQWLRLSQSAGPWFTAQGTAGMAPGSTATPAWSFGPLPFGAAAVQQPEAQRVWELVARLAQLQAQLAAHWSEIARSAAQRFVARVGSLSAVPSADQTLKLYEQWVSCAEEAYAATARRDDFARLQSELANVSAALLVEQRRHAESLVRAFGLPTRTEVDALYAHIKDLSRRLAQFEEGARPPPASRAAAPRAAGKSAPGKPARGKRATPKRRRRT